MILRSRSDRPCTVWRNSNPLIQLSSPSVSRTWSIIYMASPPSLYTGSSRLTGSTTDSSAAVTSRRDRPTVSQISFMVGSRPSCFSSCSRACMAR